jgi:hypothetical protein
VAVNAGWRDERGEAVESLRRRQDRRVSAAGARFCVLVEQVLGIDFAQPRVIARQQSAAHERAQQPPADLHLGDGGGLEPRGGSEDDPTAAAASNTPSMTTQWKCRTQSSLSYCGRIPPRKRADI